MGNRKKAYERPQLVEPRPGEAARKLAEFEQLEKEDALRESEKRYRDIVDNALIGVFKTNLEGDILYVNDAMARIFEYDSPGEITGANVNQVYKDMKDRNAFLEQLTKVGHIKNFEFETVTKSGRIKNIIANAVLNGDEISGMLMDITKRKKTEIALSESQRTLNSMLNATDDIALLIDLDGTVITANTVACEKMSTRAVDIIGSNIYALMPPEVAAYRKKVADEVIRTKSPYHFNEKRLDRYYDSNLYPILDDQGDVERLAIFAKDITELKHSGEELKKAHKKL